MSQSQVIFSIFDVLGNQYLPLCVYNSLGDAVRTFIQLSRQKDTSFSLFPSDYRITFEGSFLNSLCVSGHPSCLLEWPISFTFSDVINASVCVDGVIPDTERVWTTLVNIYLNNNNNNNLGVTHV